MRFHLEVSPDIVAVMAKEWNLAGRAVETATRVSGASLKRELRGQVIRGGLGRRLANSVRMKAYANNGLNAAAIVWTSATKIVEGHSNGGIIHARGGRWMPLPLPAAGKPRRYKKMTPAYFSKVRGKKLVAIVPRGTEPGYLLAKYARGFVPVFLLVKRISLRPVLDFNGAARRIGGRLAGNIVRLWVSSR